MHYLSYFLLHLHCTFYYIKFLQLNSILKHLYVVQTDRFREKKIRKAPKGSFLTKNLKHYQYNFPFY